MKHKKLTIQQNQQYCNFHDYLIQFVIKKTQYNDNDQLMKKKINISVYDIVHNNAHKNTQPHHRTDQSTPIIVDKPVRYEDLFKKLVDQNNKVKDQGLKVIYERNRITPIPTQRVKKNSLVCLTNSTKSHQSTLNSRKNSQSQIISPQITGSAKLQKEKKKISRQKVGSREKSRDRIKIEGNKVEHSFKLQKKKSSNSLYLSNNIEDCLKYLDHTQHSHLSHRNQCFLSEREINCILEKLGYDLNHSKYRQLLELLEVDIYGGAQLQNLKKVLAILETGRRRKNSSSSKLRGAKIVDNNLELSISKQKENEISRYFQDFFPKLNSAKSIEKENQSNHSNQKESCRVQSFENRMKSRKNSQPESFRVYNQPNLSSPEKKINNTIISDLIQALIQSDKKKDSDKKNQIFDKDKRLVYDENEQDQSTFRKIEDAHIEGVSDGPQYNFSRELTGHNRTVVMREDDNITQLKNKLNEALKKTSFQTNQFKEDEQFSSFVYSNPIKYSNKKPVLSVDVNLGQGQSEKIMVFEGQTAKQVSERLASKFTINEQTKQKFQRLLESHLKNMLWKIDQLSEQMLTDREPDF